MPDPERPTLPSGNGDPPDVHLALRERIRRVFRRNRREFTIRYVDVNPPLPLASITGGDSGLRFSEETARACRIAMKIFTEAGLPVHTLPVWYIVNGDTGLVSELEARYLPRQIARRAYEALNDAGLGGFLAEDEDCSTLGLPHAVMSFEKIQVLEGDSRDPFDGLPSGNEIRPLPDPGTEQMQHLPAGTSDLPSSQAPDQ